MTHFFVSSFFLYSVLGGDPTGEKNAHGCDLCVGDKYKGDATFAYQHCMDADGGMHMEAIKGFNPYVEKNTANDKVCTDRGKGWMIHVMTCKHEKMSAGDPKGDHTCEQIQSGKIRANCCEVDENFVAKSMGPMAMESPHDHEHSGSRMWSAMILLLMI